MKDIPVLLTPVKLGIFSLKNRVVMAPLTRRRATDDHVPTDIMRIYYQQRAEAGMIIAEATNISLQAVGYMNSPGIFTKEQIEGWKPITNAVHEKGGLFFLQLWHVGRISNNLLQPGNQPPVSASAIKASGIINTPKGHLEKSTPRALETEEIPGIVEDYRKAALNAMKAGFDGVEIHGANGYLPNQFLNDGSNKRSDKYGGTIENRARFLMEITEACCRAIGSNRVGVRLSPSGVNNDMFDSEVVKLYEYVISALNDFNLVFLELMEPYAAFDPPEKFAHYVTKVAPHYRKFFHGPLITNVGYTFESGNKIVEDKYADIVSFGKLFISNPDLVRRFETGAKLNPWNKDTFYYGGEKGYIDYPSL